MIRVKAAPGGSGFPSLMKHADGLLSQRPPSPVSMASAVRCWRRNGYRYLALKKATYAGLTKYFPMYFIQEALPVHQRTINIRQVLIFLMCK